jgi:hypothetical protein
MSKSKSLYSALLVFATVLFYGCESNPPATTPASSVQPTVTASSIPVVYDIICFRKSNDLTQWGVRCKPDKIYKVPRGTKVTTWITKTVSVQQGNQAQTNYEIDTKQESINVSEMESLSSGDAKIYALDGGTDMQRGILGYVTVVFAFDKSSGEFKRFREGEFQSSGEKMSTITFETGT